MRQFLAIELSDALREDLRALSERLRQETGGWRWVAPASIHLTLRFLGEVPGDRDAPSRALWREAAAAASRFTLRLEGIGSFPPRGRPRVLWVGVHEDGPAGRLQRLAEDLEGAARTAGFEPENRPFRPHLTLARARRNERPGFPERREFVSRASLDVRDVVLFRSELHSSGARYSILDRYPLEGG